jgi:hypothetical protein
VNIRRLVLDVDKAIRRPELVDLAAAIDAVEGVEGVNIVVDEIDTETVGTEIVVEGEGIDFDALTQAIESSGAIVRSVDELAVGERLVQRRPHESR